MCTSPIRTLCSSCYTKRVSLEYYSQRVNTQKKTNFTCMHRLYFIILILEGRHFMTRSDKVPRRTTVREDRHYGAFPSRFEIGYGKSNFM